MPVPQIFFRKRAPGVEEHVLLEFDCLVVADKVVYTIPLEG